MRCMEQPALTSTLMSRPEHCNLGTAEAEIPSLEGGGKRTSFGNCIVLMRAGWNLLLDHNTLYIANDLSGSQLAAIFKQSYG